MSDGRQAGAEGLEPVAGGLSFPTSLAFDGDGRLYVAESGLALDRESPPDDGGRVLRLEADGTWRRIAGGLRAPVNGLTWWAEGGELIVSEGGHPGRIGRLGAGGGHATVLDGLPGAGNYHTNMVAIGPDGRFYFSVGAMTNSGVVGLDGSELAWLRKVEHSWDVPGLDLVLTGESFATPAAPGSSETAVTGAFGPFGTPGRAGRRVPAALPCTAAVLCCRPDGSELELVAWGLRNAYGLAFAPDGRLLATDQGADDRGSRPIGDAPELLYEVRAGAWYGWPDFVGGVPVTDPAFRPERGPQPSFLLANHDELPAPERPLARLPVHGAATKMAFAPAGSRYEGHLFVALFGDEKPMTAPAGPRVGRSVVRVDLSDGSYRLLARGPFRRPIDVAVGPEGRWLYVLDFGELEMRERGRVDARAGTGGVWKMAIEKGD